MPPSRAFRRTILLVLLVAAPFARGEEAGETIDVLGERPRGSPRAPAAQSSTIEVGLYAGEVRSVSEILQASPGATVHALGGPGQTATLSLRGATADQSVVLLDGIPLQGPGGGAIDLATIPSSLLDRMIVTRGVVGAQFGAGALGGVVELVPTELRGRTRAGAQLSAGSFGTYQAAADVAAPLWKGGSGVVAVQADRTGGAFEYDRQVTPEIASAPYYGFPRLNDDSKRLSGLARLSQPFGELEADLLLQGSAGNRGLPGPAAFPTTRSRERDSGGLAGVRLRSVGADPVWSVRAWGRADAIELRGVQSMGDCQDGTPTCPRIAERSSATAAEGEYRFAIGDAHRARISVEGGEEWVHGDDPGAHQRARISAAVNDDIAAPAGLALHPALRVERIGASNGASPALTASWRPSEQSPIELRAGWGLSFRAPTFTELYLDQNGVAANPALRPERAWSLDGGAAWNAGRISVAASVFWSSYRDLIVYEYFPPAHVKPFNVGRARIAGAELQVSARLPAGFGVDIAYSYLDTANLQDGAQQGHQLAYRPPHRFFSRLSRRGDRVEGYGELSFTSASPRNAYDTAFQPAQLLLNAGIGLRAAGPVWLDLEVKNLLDDRTLEDLFQYPLPGLSVALVARARL